MRTKTLLSAVAALAVGVATSMAQTTYSQNVVGYVNISLTNGALQCISPALDADGTGTNNTIASVFVAPAVNDSLFVFNGGTYDNLIYKKTGHSPNFVTNWTLGATITNNYHINPGQALFYLPAATETATMVGNVLQGTNLVNAYFPTVGSINLLSSQVPISGGLTTVLGYKPNVNDSVFIYNGASYDNYIYKKSGHSPNFVTNWTLGAASMEPVVNVGQGFWLLPSASSSWTQNFIVQ